MTSTNPMAGWRVPYTRPDAPAERLDEVARLLALGYLRLRAGGKRKKPMIRTT